MSQNFLVTIASKEPGSDLETGYTYPIVPGRVVIGRQSDVEVCIKDGSISRKHLELWAMGGRIRLRNLSRNGSTFIDGRRLAWNEEFELEERLVYAQVGRALLKIQVVADTVPVSQVLPIPAQIAREEARFLMIEASRSPRVWLGGKPMALFPAAGRVLVRLCESPGEVVHAASLLTAIDPDFADQAAGGINLSQNIRYIRKMFMDALKRELFTLEALRNHTSPGIALDPAVTPEVLARILVAKSDIGYTLGLHKAAVRVKMLSQPGS